MPTLATSTGFATRPGLLRVGWLLFAVVTLALLVVSAGAAHAADFFQLTGDEANALVDKAKN